MNRDRPDFTAMHAWNRAQVRIAYPDITDGWTPPNDWRAVAPIARLSAAGRDRQCDVQLRRLGVYRERHE